MNLAAPVSARRNGAPLALRTRGQLLVQARPGAPDHLGRPPLYRELMSRLTDPGAFRWVSVQIPDRPGVIAGVLGDQARLAVDDVPPDGGRAQHDWRYSRVHGFLERELRRHIGVRRQGVTEHVHLAERAAHVLHEPAKLHPLRQTTLGGLLAQQRRRSAVSAHEEPRRR